jgi:4-amino-4-deoxy-L-arabinose transferase-like glycosyltransferase
LGAIITPILAYFLVKEISGTRTAILTTILVSVNWHWTFWAYHATAEIRQIMFGIITLILLQRGIKDSSKTYFFSLSGTLFALAFHTKIQAVALTLPVLTLLYYGRENLRRDSIPLFLLAFAAMMLALAPTSASYAFLSFLTEKRTQRGLSINLPGLTKYLIENILRVPYEISIPTTLFTIYGLHQLVRGPRTQKDLYLVWFASYFTLYTFISEFLHKNIGYYSQNWMIPLLIFTATGMQRLLQNQNSTRNQILVLIAVLSTTIEGPLPFLRLTTEIPFIVLKDSLICYRRLLVQVPPPTERSRLFYETMSNFVPETYIIPEDIALLTAILFPLAISLLSRSRILQTKPK